jgi:hypothetical protein
VHGLRLEEVDWEAVLLVPHCLQTSTWDCGLACVAMVMAELSLKVHSLMQRTPSQWRERVLHCWLELSGEPSRGTTNANTSVWTVDLFFVLEAMLSEVLAEAYSNNRNNVTTTATPTFAEIVSFTTTQMEADATYRDLPYYRNGFDEDARRVNALFCAAEKRGWNVSCREVPLECILRDLELKRGVYICLVNLAYLACTCRTVGQCIGAASAAMSCGCCLRGAGESDGNRKRTDSEEDTAEGRVVPSDHNGVSSCCLKRFVPYVGHYIVLVGVDRARSRILYRDPAQPSGAVCSCALSWFQRARQSTGTDQDLVFVRLGVPLMKNAVA